MTQVLNLERKGALFEDEDNTLNQTHNIHIRVVQRTNRKRITFVEGLPQKLNFHRTLRDLRKKLNCNGSIIEDPDLGNVIQLQGDHRQEVFNFLVETKISPDPNHIQIHGIT
uniref:SUI1 domain-containing protein n=1 Tax=Arcella intermedia TaxID=1963864 RepID=A0A6B2LT26_9EUKA